MKNLFLLRSLLPSTLLVLSGSLSAQQFELARTNHLVKSQLIEHAGFTVSYNQDTRQPNWVAWELTSDETTGTNKRDGVKFQPDPSVLGENASTNDYSGSGWDRGHMAPAGDMRWNQHAMEQCFYLSNICPQDKALNAGAWEKLETRCRVLARQNVRVWICCGPIFGPTPATIGQNNVPIPESFFKVICMKSKSHGNSEYFYHALGFILPNKVENDAQTGKPKPFWDYSCPVDSVEAVTGHDFFFNLPDPIEQYIERLPEEAGVWRDKK